MPPTPAASQVNAVPPAPSAEAARHFAAKLALETDPSDVADDLASGAPDVVVVDVRSRHAHADLHVPGALSMPYPTIDEAAVERLRGKTVVVYCWSSTCNAAAKGALRLARLGVPVKELLGGLEAWVHEGYGTEGELPREVSFADYQRHHHDGTGRTWAAGHGGAAPERP